MADNTAVSADLLHRRRFVSPGSWSELRIQLQHPPLLVGDDAVRVATQRLCPLCKGDEAVWRQRPDNSAMPSSWAGSPSSAAITAWSPGRGKMTIAIAVRARSNLWAGSLSAQAYHICAMQSAHLTVPDRNGVRPRRFEHTGQLLSSVVLRRSSMHSRQSAAKTKNGDAGSHLFHFCCGRRERSWTLGAAGKTGCAHECKHSVAVIAPLNICCGRGRVAVNLQVPASREFVCSGGMTTRRDARSRVGK